MKTKNKKRRVIETFLLAGILTIVFLPLVISAVGLSTDYNSRYPITVEPGETKDIVFGRLQNIKEQDVSIKIELIDGSEIATITSQDLDSFVVPAGTRNTEIKVRIFISEDTAEGTQDMITIKYTELATSEGEGMIGFTESKTISLPVLVRASEKPAATSTTLVILIILVVIAAAIVIIYFIVKKQPVVEKK